MSKEEYRVPCGNLFGIPLERCGSAGNHPLCPSCTQILAQRDEIEKLRADLAAAQQELDYTESEVRRLTGWIASEGYVRCDISACNCGWFHGGHAHRRLSEFIDELGESGVEMNGKTALTALKEALQERDSAREALRRHHEWSIGGVQGYTAEKSDLFRLTREALDRNREGGE